MDIKALLNRPKGRWENLLLAIAAPRTAFTRHKYATEKQRNGPGSFPLDRRWGLVGDVVDHAVDLVLHLVGDPAGNGL